MRERLVSGNYIKEDQKMEIIARTSRKLSEELQIVLMDTHVVIRVVQGVEGKLDDAMPISWVELPLKNLPFITTALVKACRESKAKKDIPTPAAK